MGCITSHVHPQERQKVASKDPRQPSSSNSTAASASWPKGVVKEVTEEEREEWLDQLRYEGLDSLDSMPEQLRTDKVFFQAAVRIKGFALRQASDELKADRELVFAAVQENGIAIQYADNVLKVDRGIVLEAVQKSGYLLHLAGSDLQSDREIVLTAVQESGLALQFAATHLKSDRELVLQAVQQTGLALEFAGSDLRSDRELVLEAVKNCGLALAYADGDLRLDHELVLTAVGGRGFKSVQSHIGATLFSNREFVLALVRIDGDALEHAADDVRSDPEIQLAAAAQLDSRAERCEQQKPKRRRRRGGNVNSQPLTMHDI